MVPVPVLSKARLLLKTVRDRTLASESSRYASSACRSSCIFAENYSTLSLQEKLCLLGKIGPKLPSNFDDFFASGSGRALRLPEAKKRLLRALSMVPVPVLSKARLLLKTYRDRRFAPESSRYASSACRSTCVFAESFSISSHKEELCKHRQFGKKLPSTFDEFFASAC
ncbi:unnamed protein product [Coccothraustes coccothraustes]